MWLQLHSDNGISSVPLAEAIGVTQKTAWRMGHTIRLLTANGDQRLDGVVEADEVFVGGKPKKDPSHPDARAGMPGHTTKRPILAAVERQIHVDPGAAPGTVRSVPLPGLSGAEVGEALAGMVAPEAHLMSDGHKSFASAGSDFAKHDTVTHSELEFVRGIVHVNSTESFNDRVRRTVVGGFHHISPKHVQLYFDETGFRRRQRIFCGLANRTTKSGRVVARRQWDRKPASQQMREFLRGAVGRQFRRIGNGGHQILSDRALFGL